MRAYLASIVLLIAATGVACDSRTRPETSVVPPDDSSTGRESMLLIAHRGASGLAPEHTRASFELAVEIGADYLEQDLQQTSDGVLVVLHDDTLERTARGPEANCRGRVRDKTLVQLETCDFGAWFAEAHPASKRTYSAQRILTLDALIAHFGRSVRYYIETKNPEEAAGMEASLISILSQHGLLDARGDPSPVFLQSFSAESLRALAIRAPAIPRLQLLDRGQLTPPYDLALEQIASYADGIGPQYSDVDAELVAAAHRRGLEVHSYTVNKPREMRRLMDLGVDAIFSDFPNRYQALLRTVPATR